MIRKVLFNIFLVLTVLSLASCGFSDILQNREELTQETPPLDESQDGLREEIPMVPNEGGILRVSLVRPDKMHPFATKSKDVISFLGLIYEGLFAYGEDLNPRPALVDSYKVSDEGKRWEFQLRKGVTWHDGKELTAQDVKYTFDLLLNQMARSEEETSIYAWNLPENFDTARMELLLNNPQGFAITLNEPVGISFLEALTFPILPRRGDVEQIDEEDINSESISIEDIDTPIGTGPYKVQAMGRGVGEEIRLIRNEVWWGSEKPYIDSIVAHIYKDNMDAIEAFKAGEIDVTSTHIIIAESYYMGGDTQLYRYLTNHFHYIGINYKNPGILGDKLIRKAIAYGIDRKDIISRVYANNAQGVDLPMPPDAWYYDPELRLYDHQPAKAKDLLKKAGWTQTNEEGYLEKDGMELKFTITGHLDSVMEKETLNLITEQLKEIGIRVDTNLLPWEEYLEILEEREFEAFIGEYYLETLPDLGAMFYSSDSGQGLNNYWGYNNEELEALIDNIPIIEDAKKYEENYKKIQELLVEELPLISLYYKTSSLITNGRVNGVKGPRELMVYRNIDEWFLSQPKPEH